MGRTSTSWRPGTSGNPGGRPRGIEARCREFTDEALQALRAALQNPRERVQAAAILLDRGWGKPVQPVQDEGQTSIGVLHLIAAREVSEEIERALAAGNGTAPPVIDGEPASEENTTEPQQHEPIDILAPAKE